MADVPDGACRLTSLAPEYRKGDIGSVHGAPAFGNCHSVRIAVGDALHPCALHALKRRLLARKYGDRDAFRNVSSVALRLDERQVVEAILANTHRPVPAAHLIRWARDTRSACFVWNLGIGAAR